MAKSLSFTESPTREFYGGKSLLTLFAKIKFSRKFPNLQYIYLNYVILAGTTQELIIVAERAKLHQAKLSHYKFTMGLSPCM